MIKRYSKKDVSFTTNQNLRWSFLPDTLVVNGPEQIKILCGMLFIPAPEGSECILKVHFKEKLSAGNQVSGGFFKGEQKGMSEEEIISARFIDRCLRPLVQEFINGISHHLHIDVRVLDSPNYIHMQPRVIGLIGVMHLLHQRYSFEPDYDCFQVEDKLGVLNFFTYKGRLVSVEFKGFWEYQKVYGEISPHVSEASFVPETRSEQPVFLSRVYVAEDIGPFIQGFRSECVSLIPEDKTIAYKRLFYKLNRRGRMGMRGDTEQRSMDINLRPLQYPDYTIMYQKGMTKVLTYLKISDLKQAINTIYGNFQERLNVQYNFYGLSTGSEDRATRNRREFGHGRICRGALEHLFYECSHPNCSVFIQNEILGADGSTSMSSVVSSSIALYMMGITNRLVYGVTLGTLNGTQVRVDLNRFEDWFGMLDCKVCGTEGHITYLQLDVKKLEVISSKLLNELFEKMRGSLTSGIEKVQQEVDNIKKHDYKDLIMVKEYLQLKNEKHMMLLFGYKGSFIKHLSSMCKIDVNRDNRRVMVVGLRKSARECCKIIEGLADQTFTPTKAVISYIQDGSHIVQPLNGLKYGWLVGVGEEEFEFKIGDVVFLTDYKEEDGRLRYTLGEDEDKEA